MPQDFDSDFDLPLPTKVKIAKRAFAGAVVVVSVIGLLLAIALDSFKAALANVGITAPSNFYVPMLLAVLLALFVFFSVGFYYALYQQAKKFIDQLH